MRKHIRYTAEQDAFIHENQYGISRAELAVKFNAHFGTSVTSEQMKTACTNRGLKNGRTGHFPKGHVPFVAGTKGFLKRNKGSFPKGHVPHNHRPVGSERITKDGYIEIKVAEPNKFDLKHRVVWREHFGEIPDTHCLRFLDNDKTNCSIDNLLLIPRGANATVNIYNKADTGNRELNKAILLTETLKHEIRKLHG